MERNLAYYKGQAVQFREMLRAATTREQRGVCQMTLAYARRRIAQIERRVLCQS